MSTHLPLSFAEQLLQLPAGTLISKRQLFDLIQFSKQPASTYWQGSDWIIGNTPQQGINWIGLLPAVRAVIIKTRPGSYDADGWEVDRRFRYSLKARNAVVNRAEKANAVLLQQPAYGYPVLLLTERKDQWYLEGRFQVCAEEGDTVLLEPLVEPAQPFTAPDSVALVFREGQASYQLHQSRERNQAVVALLKSLQEWRCEICAGDMLQRYGVPFIEAHHRVPLSQQDGEVAVTIHDFALLCPNCHTAVHACMARDGLDYDDICRQLRQQLAVHA